MSSRRAIAASPVLIGAATVFVVVVAVFLAYNANNGLPFVPSYRVDATLPSADALVVGNDVRIAGTRVGVITAITPEQDPRTGRVTARLQLKLERRVAPLPRDSTVIVRARSALGLKYLQINKGHGRSGYPQNGVIPLRQARPVPVDIDQVFRMFPRRTRAAQQENLFTFSAALAGRGTSINAALGRLPALLADLEPVMARLAQPRTGLRRFIDALAGTAEAVAPVAEQQAGFFTGLDATFSALAGVTTALQEAIALGPATLDTTIRSLARQRPFLATSTRFFAALRPAADALAAASGPLGAAIGPGGPTLTAAVGLNARLTGVLDALGAFGRDAAALDGIGRLTATALAAAPLLDTLEPSQRRCNYPALLLRNVAQSLSDGDGNGRWLTAAATLPAVGINSEGSPSSQPADGPIVETHLHDTTYPYVGAAGQPAVCEAGNERYTPGLTTIGHASALSGSTTESLTAAPEGAAR